MATDPQPDSPRKGKQRKEPGSGRPGNGFGLAALLLLLGSLLLRLLPFRMLGGLGKRSSSHHAPKHSGIAASQAQGSLRPGAVGHETRDISVPWVFGIVGFLLVSGLAIHFILAGMFSGLKKSAPPVDRWRPVERSAGTPSAGPTPAYPALQVSPPADLQAFREREEAELHSYGWVNRSAGVVRIPIEKAMNLLLEKGLPVREAPAEGKAGPSSYQLMQQRLPPERPAYPGEQQ